MKAHAPAAAPVLSGGLIFLIALACGAMVANIYYAQTLIDLIGPEIGLSPHVAGAITTLTQLGYGVGLALIVPLGDLYENKRLALIGIAGAIAGSIGIALSTGPAEFLIASVVTGICATAAQILLPLASHLARPERQGRVIGWVMSGLLTGIMLARPVASFTAHAVGWRAIFWGSAGLMTAIGIALLLACPSRTPEGGHRYGEILRSVVDQMRRHRALRLRAAYQAALFAAFNLFWTAAPLVLIHQFGLSQDAVALFALAGAGGALAAPVAGWLADHRHGWAATLGALMVLTVGFLLADRAVAAGGVVAFALVAIAVDAAVQVSQITGQRIIFSLSSDARARVNAAYLTVMFAVGATGSLIGSAVYESGGWHLAAMTGAGIGAATLALFLIADRGASH